MSITKEGEDQVVDLVDSLMDAELGHMKQEEVKGQGDPQPGQEETQDQGQGQGEELNFGDMPNGQIRYEKNKKKLDSVLSENSELKQALARLEGKFEMFTSQSEAGKEPEVDPTEEMTATEKFLYEQNKKLQETIEGLNGKVGSFEEEKQKADWKAQEKTFYEQNKELDPAKTKEVIVNYVKNNEEVGRLLLQKKLSLSQVYGLANPQKKAESSTQDSSTVFGNGKTEPAKPRMAQSDDGQIRSAIDTLRSESSMNKGEAVEILGGSIVDDIVSLLDNY